MIDEDFFASGSSAELDRRVDGDAFLSGGRVENALFGGWQMNGILSIQSGHTFTPTFNVNVANADAGHRKRLLFRHRRARLRSSGSDTTIEVDIAAPAAMRAAFDTVHRKRFGYVEERAELIVDTLMVDAIAASEGFGAGVAPAGPGARRVRCRWWSGGCG